MVTVTFPDRNAEKRALGFLLGRFSGWVLRTGEYLIPEAALETLADANIPFTVQGKPTYEEQLAAVRGAGLGSSSSTRATARPPLPQAPPLTPEHPIFRLIGAGRGGGQPPGSRDKHTILG